MKGPGAELLATVRPNVNAVVDQYSGLGTHQDSLAALAWYRRAAEQGSAPAAFNVAVMLDSGLGAPRDSAQALTWYKRADKGFARAQYNLAVQYESGNGVPRDIPQAITLYRRPQRKASRLRGTTYSSLGSTLR